MMMIAHKKLKMKWNMWERDDSQLVTLTWDTKKYLQNLCNRKAMTNLLFKMFLCDFRFSFEYLMFFFCTKYSQSNSVRDQVKLTIKVRSVHFTWMNEWRRSTIPGPWKSLRHESEFCNRNRPKGLRLDEPWNSAAFHAASVCDSK